MHWTVAAPFFTESNISSAGWLDDLVPEGFHSFTKIPRRERLTPKSWHDRATRATLASEWLSFWNQSEEAWKTTSGGCITVFPQLAAMVGLKKRLSSRDIPIVAWCFNVGNLYPGLKQRLASFGLQHIDKFIVHSRRESETVSQWLGFPESRFEFVPLQRAPIPVLESEDMDDPFILAMGSANRDYRTFFSAIEKLGIRTIVVAGQRTMKDLAVPATVEVRSGLTVEDCHRLAQKARVNVIPLIDHHTASGQVTIVEAMQMSRPVVATRCTGSEDYIQHGKTGFLVRPYSVDEMVDSISQLWSDDQLRTSLGKEAGEYAKKHFSDETAGMHLNRILNQFR